MAAVVSHAMRRFPTSPPDTSFSSCRFRGDLSSASGGGCSPAAAAASAAGSALSRSMRYADPWLYPGSGGLGGGSGGGLLLTPAFVLCSCADYLNGTKRAKKNAPHQCRKCGGTRLPLTALDPSAKFGTVRCYPTAPVHPSIAIPQRAGTVRANPSYHARPTILPDPYDLMRRSRLEGQTQHRSRSISPKKANKSKSPKSEPYNTVGRRSILECDINPYELVSADDGPKAKESSIKFVNGQRIRVRPSLCDLEYEDVQVKSPNQQNQQLLKTKEKHTEHVQSSPKKSPPTPKTTPSSPKALSNKDPDLTSRFKSILKKPSTNYSDTDSDNYGERSLSPPIQKGGSQFYLPLPTVRKKVQFLMENIRSRKNSEDAIDKLENGYNSTKEDTKASQRIDIKKATVEKDQDKKIDATPQKETRRACNLNRSLSDRALSKESSVVFHDTMALRQKKRVDCRIDFSDLEKLDGITSKTRKLSNAGQKPDVHMHALPRTIVEEIKDGIKKPDEKKEETKSLDQEKDPPTLSNQSEKLPDLVDNDTKKVIESLKEELKPLRNEAVTTVSKSTSHQINTSKTYEDVESACTRKSSDDGYEVLPDEKTSLEKLDKCLKEVQQQAHFFYENIPPQAPPRKRSNGKQSSPPPGEELVKVTMSPTIHTVRIDSPNNSLSDYTNKTVVQVNSPPAVHKIQIKNEFSDNSNTHSVSILDNPQRKTSILINGDDCYSTVNVSDDIPLYQSSVVVNDTITETPPAKSMKKSSTVYITGSFVPTPEEPRQETQSDYKATTKEYVTSSDVLKELLRDPVEAVKRNLVPHVCGKAEVSRRPRDRKLFNHIVQSLVGDVPEEKTMEESFLRLRNYETVGDDVSSEHSSSTQYELMDPGSDCYTDNSNRSSVNEDELSNRTKFYELLAEPAEIEVADSDDHHYESIKMNNDPIYEEIEIPPPLPSNPPPSSLLDDLNLDKEFTTRSIFEGASKYDILSYLVDAKERGIVQEQEDNYSYAMPVEEENKEAYNRVSQMSTVSDSSEDNSLVISGALIDEKAICQKSAEVERNDSGVGSETSKSSLSKYRTKQEVSALCEDCDIILETKVENEPLLCRKCGKKRSERKEIITEIVETEEKYSRDLQIILEEFYQPMLVAGLLTPEQLSAIFLNVEELLENSQALAERLRDAVEIALEQGDDDLLTVNMGKLFLEATPMLHAFETYCIRQGAASLLLASLEKEKELLRIFLRVSQMENTMLRRMNLNSFLMVPVQRVTKYPLLLARLYKVTPPHLDHREELKEAQHKIELHLNHMNSETKDVPSKLWRRIGNNSGRRSSAEMDLVNIKLRKIAVDVLEWNHDEAKFIMEGKLLFTQPTDNNWRKGRTIKLTPVNALLVHSIKSSDRSTEDNHLIFAKSGAREAALLLVRDKNGRYSLLREPLYLDRCIIAADPSWQSYFEVQELLGKDTFIFKAEDEEQTQLWYKQLQFHAQGLGAWRKRRNALANIMINGMGLRS
ncbi:unnamed protein product [Callosobruchus maculatus]|uniref:DH domain-containing protein n=1 Tax=Callosobruchus maculatus TaxID=64391 RepID=A0A653DJE8_CALMS|nr:unnamed protein product [Callosobruchus maculatus]